jgi:serine/threonine protein phosphatase 1
MRVHLTREAFPLPRAVERDVEVFAIGDIHGRADLLEALLDAASREPREAATRRLVFLGDLVDRGPENVFAIRLALGAPRAIGADSSVGLMGNHETMMRMALDVATPRRQALDALATWSDNGGDCVIAEILENHATPPTLDALLDDARASLPYDIRHWLENLEPHARSGDVLFVHAGVNPRFAQDRFLAAPWNTPLARLDEDRHWAWVRRPFLAHKPGPEGWEGRFVVHGHTPNDGGATASHGEQILRSRLNLDGGSAMTGVAKMGIFRGGLVEVVSARDLAGTRSWRSR